MNMFLGLRSGRLSALVALAGLGLLFTASGAKAAGCAPPYKTAGVPSIPYASPHEDDFQGGEDSRGSVSIVGLWHVLYTGNTDNNFPPGGPFPPTPFPFVESLKTWNADGTELENAFLPPAGGNVCFGVWKELGHGSVKLHHIGLMFGGPGAVPPQEVSNIFTDDEKVTVAPNGKTYKGTFDFKLYAPSDCANSPSGYVCTGPPISEVTGTVYGVRINVD
jgi:hypothetical protein